MKRFPRFRALGLFLAVGLCSVAAKCGEGDVRKTLVVLNDLQEHAAQAYEDASAQEKAAGRACLTAALAKGVTLPDPANAPGAAMTACAALGVPIPFQPVKLEAAAKPINAAFDAIRAAEAMRQAVNAGTAKPGELKDAVLAALSYLLDGYETATDAGVKGLEAAKVSNVMREVAK